MKFYGHDENGIYIGEINGQKNPRGNGYLMPGNSTDIKPPSLKESEDAKFSEGTWTIVKSQKYIEEMLKKKNSNDINTYKTDENGDLKKLSTAEISEKKKENDGNVLYLVMKKDIYDEMEKVFETKNDISASATAQTWEAMLKRPENYSGKLGFADTGEVLAYAAAKIALADAYGIYRMERIQQFLSDKAAL